eukprot:g11419.t1 g11419   contig5:797117-799236(-)
MVLVIMRCSSRRQLRHDKVLTVMCCRTVAVLMATTCSLLFVTLALPSATTNVVFVAADSAHRNPLPLPSRTRRYDDAMGSTFDPETNNTHILGEGVRRGTTRQMEQSDQRSPSQLQRYRGANTYGHLSEDVPTRDGDIIQTTTLDSEADLQMNNIILVNRRWRKDPIQMQALVDHASEVPTPPIIQEKLLPSYTPRPRLIVEFDTNTIHSSYGNGILRNRIRSRIGTIDRDWNGTQQPRGPTLSISLDAFAPSSPTPTQSMTQTQPPINNRKSKPMQSTLLLPLLTTVTMLAQTTLLLPSLLLSRRVLNSTWNALVDYFRGRYFRNTFTRMERAYLRYYEFPAVTRAISRIVSQIGILFGLSWLVRLWMIVVLMGHGAGPTLVSLMETGVMETGSESVIGPGWKVGLPCQHDGSGVAWLCGMIWVSTVVGAGHACAMALSVWGGPLRLQAAAQQPKKPNHVLSWIIHHPIQWIRELDEWKHLPSFSSLVNAVKGDSSKRRGGSQGGRDVFDLDPLLFPSTWLPLRWLQIFAIAKAFATDPQKYRWCSPENNTTVVHRLMTQYLVQLTLGDEWRRVFLGEKRVGLGILVVISYFIALSWMIVTAFTLDGGAAAMLIPSLLASMISCFMNIMVFWNRMGSREQRRTLVAMGWSE